MATTTPSNSKSPATSNKTPAAEPPKAAEQKPIETQQAPEPVQASEAPATQTPAEPAKSNDKTIISLSVPEKLARQVRLLSKLEGKSISAIFLDAVAGEIPSRLKVALASIVED